FEFLKENDFIEEIEQNHYVLKVSFGEIEDKFYEEENEKLKSKLGIKDIKKEISDIIKQMNVYNEIKDIAQSLMGRIAEIRGVTNKEIHEEMDVLEE
ncbi:Swi5 family protein, partial [Spraguea lophii 42_110]